MNSVDFQNRTKKLGLHVIRFVEMLPQNYASRVIINPVSYTHLCASERVDYYDRISVVLLHL